MIIKPEKSTRVISEYLQMPCGISVSWEDGLPFKIIKKIIEISKDDYLIKNYD